MAPWPTRSTQSESDWRVAAAPADLREYDAFGPWIDPIRSEVDMPRRFRDYYAEHREARFLLKVPRNEDRADLRPGDDLYAAVLAVHNDGVCLLQLERGVVVSRETNWAGIVATNSWVNLLEARWSLLLADGGSIELDHNSASAGGLARAIDYIHTQITADDVPGWRPDRHPALVNEDLFTSKLSQLQRSLEPPVVAIHFERRNRRCRDERNRVRLSTGVMLVESARELVIVSRGEPMRSRFFPAHGCNLARIPFQRLDSFVVLAPQVGSRSSFHTLRLHAGSQVISQLCLDRPDAVIAALSGRGIPESSPAGQAVDLR